MPIQLRLAFPDDDVNTAQWMGWAGLDNGDLLNAAEESGFDLFIVADKNLRHQQNLIGRRLAILELWTNHRPTIERHMAYIRAATQSIQPGAYITVEAPQSR